MYCEVLFCRKKKSGLVSFKVNPYLFVLCCRWRKQRQVIVIAPDNNRTLNLGKGRQRKRRVRRRVRWIRRRERSARGESEM